MRYIVFIVFFFNCVTLPTKSEIEEEQKEYVEKVEEQKVLINQTRHVIIKNKCGGGVLEKLDEIESISNALKKKNAKCIKDQLTCHNELKEEKDDFYKWLAIVGSIVFVIGVTIGIKIAKK